MAEANTFTTLNGNFKEIYADKIETLVPEGLKLINKVPFMKGEKVLGNLYHQP